MRSIIRHLKIGGFACLILLATFAQLGAQEQTVGLFVYDPGSSYEGYTLFPPGASTTTYLIDNYGRYIHSWPSSYKPGKSAYLLENGNLLRTAQLTGGSGSGGRVQEIAWDGTIVWDFQYYTDDYRQHHDIEPLPNGNVLLLAWEYKTNAEALAAGRDPALLPGIVLWTEHVVEVEPVGPTGGNIVWEWHIWDHLVQDYDSTKANYGVVAEHPELLDINFTRAAAGIDWIHANAVDYNADLDQIMLCSRPLGEIWVIDHSTTTAEGAGHTGGNSGMGGDILYRWGNPFGYDAGIMANQKLYTPHDGHWVPSGVPGEGNILIFNNGGGRPGGDYSSVDEIVPPVDEGGHYPLPPPGTPHDPAEQTWIYTADPPENFHSTNISGAQRLPNGNTLICSGDDGWFFEVTPEKEIVWSYINPVVASGPLYQGDPIPSVGINVFRCHRYAPDFPGLAGRDLTPGGPIEIYPVNISGTSHLPLTPSDLDSVVVTTTITDDDGIALAELYVDIGSGYFAINMFDDGSHHDNLPGDDLYGATIPPLLYSGTVSYYIYAEDNTASSTADPPNAPDITYGYTIGDPGPAIYLNEVMAANDGCCPDEHGGYDDWIELFNADAQDINLSGMYLSNDLGNPTQFIIGDTVIPAGGFMVFWADGETEQGLSHTNFTLNVSGGQIGLFDTDVYGNRPLDILTYTAQAADISYGRFPDGMNDWMLFGAPTPGAANIACYCAQHGDLNLDEEINPIDVVYIVNFVYKNLDAREQIPTCPGDNGDWNCDEAVNPVDVVKYVNFVYKNIGGGPCDPCSP